MRSGAGGRFDSPAGARAAFFAAAFAALLCGFLAWRAVFGLTLDAMEEEARLELAFIAGALEQDLARHKLLAKSLAETSALRRRALAEFGEPEVERLLDRMEAVSGAASIEFVTPQTTPVGPIREAAQEAYRGAMGFAFDPASGGSFVVAAPIRRIAPGAPSAGGDVVGALAVRVAAADLEWSWRALPNLVFFTGPSGDVRLSGAAPLRLRRIGDGAGAAPPFEARSWGGHAIWRFADAGWRRLGVTLDAALVVETAAHSLEMTGRELIDLAPARRAAWLAAAAAGAAALLVGLGLAAALQRRAALAARLAAEAEAMAELERRVADRTAALTAEVAERRAAEGRLRAAQDDLVQAGKLSALGRMAAGLAHELNQPLAAIRGFAENGAVFLDRGRTEEARGNLARIAELTERAAQIIRHLRAFARNQPQSAAPTDMVAVVDDALALLSV
ncbi:MAG: histidine kinase dimerization/phospho-acceptor domain-containing protein, partial [Pseudomonadota bacterium]